MPSDIADHRTNAWRRCSGALGGCAAIAAFGASMFAGSATQTTDVDAHRKLVVVVTVTAQPPATPQPSDVNADKPHPIETLRATPEIRAPRTMIVKPFSP